MTDFIYDYDISTRNEEVRAAFIEEALNEMLTYVWQKVQGGTLHRLPASTFWTTKTRLTEAEQSFRDAVNATNVRYNGTALSVDKLFIAEIGDTIANSDRSKQPLPSMTHTTRLLTCMAHQHNDPFFRY